MEQQEVAAETPFGKYLFKGQSLNTLATVATLILSSIVAYVLYTHRQDAQKAGESFVAAIKEQTQAIKESTAAQREQTCVMKFDQKERRENGDWCRQISGASPTPTR